LGQKVIKKTTRKTPNAQQHHNDNGHFPPRVLSHLFNARMAKQFALMVG
jgi:hypothetical protein